ncbi:MAG: hypothetical protein U0531_12960 [Dehalococcoidia bacterium]
MRCVRPVHAPAMTCCSRERRLRSSGAAIDEAARGRLEAAGAEPRRPDPAGTDMYAAQAQEFARAAFAGEEPNASGMDGLAVTVIAAAMYESARAGREVAVEL